MYNFIYFYKMGQHQSSINSTLSKSFDLSKYIGTWYEIARFPLVWESKCINATAKYILDETGNAISVENTCILQDGSSYSRKGIAFLAEGEQSKNHLKLIFNDGLPADGLSDYWVLDTDYCNYALVGNEKRNHLWVLSRRPMMSYCVYSALKNLAQNVYRYDTNKLTLHPNTIVPCIDANIV